MLVLALDLMLSVVLVLHEMLLSVLLLFCSAQVLLLLFDLPLLCRDVCAVPFVGEDGVDDAVVDARQGGRGASPPRSPLVAVLCCCTPLLHCQCVAIAVTVMGGDVDGCVDRSLVAAVFITVVSAHQRELVLAVVMLLASAVQCQLSLLLSLKVRLCHPAVRATCPCSRSRAASSHPCPHHTRVAHAKPWPSLAVVVAG